MDVYDRIDQLLKEMGISRREAAKMAGIVPGTLNSALYRKKGLSAAAVSALAEKLGVDAGYLLTGEKTPQRQNLDDFINEASKLMELQKQRQQIIAARHNMTAQQLIELVGQYHMLLAQYRIQHPEFLEILDELRFDEKQLED